MSLGPGKVDFGGTRSVMDIGDAILCRVQEVEETHSSVVTMKEWDYGRFAPEWLKKSIHICLEG